MAARPLEVVTIPVDAYAPVRESFVSPVKRNVVIDSPLVLFDEMLRARQPSLFIDGKDEDEIALRLYIRRVERANARQQRLDVARVVAHTRSVDLSVPDPRFYLEARLKYRVHVRIEHRSEEHTSELQSLAYLVCRLLLEK